MSKTMGFIAICFLPLLAAGCPGTVATDASESDAGESDTGGVRMDAPGGRVDAPPSDDVPSALLDIPILEGDAPLDDVPFAPDAPSTGFDAPMTDVPFSTLDAPISLVDAPSGRPDVGLRLDVGGASCLTMPCRGGLTCCPLNGLCYDPGCLSCCMFSP